jgi:hypothetical protein
VSPSKCGQEAGKNVKNHFQETEPGRLQPKKEPSPLAKDCGPKVKISPELGSKDTTHCMSQIGVLRWMFKLGRVDIFAEVSIRHHS